MRIRTVLEAKKIPFEVIDVAQDQEALGRMRELVDDEEALAPQIVNGIKYCGVSILVVAWPGHDCFFKPLSVFSQNKCIELRNCTCNILSCLGFVKVEGKDDTVFSFWLRA